MVKNYIDIVMDSKKYQYMGVTPKELYLRQTGKCWLKLVYDLCGENENPVGTLYCTDGTEYAETNKMLNPTFECVQCMAKFIVENDGKHTQ